MLFNYLNYLFNNSLIICGIFIGIAAILGYYLYYSICYKSDNKNKINFINTNIVVEFENIQNTDIEDTDIDDILNAIENTNIVAPLDDIENTDIEAEFDAIENTSLDVIENTSLDAIENTSLDAIDSEIITQTVSSSIDSDLAIYESKIREIIELYSEEMFDNGITEDELIAIINHFNVIELASSDINELILAMINH